ncbi:hypothetical protein FIBSPDRAFT_777662 [Athelia psychrophila]|uniref:Uncharacterized protein n=1 Tax=Athelia psychrophila TaxID=1759441 RepID=A0A166T054_9AGAM|nr:hypothetical protein FIBSPDRAFT_777662 [Fibularhizoctonia sp. CBS 109695]
MPGPRNQKKKRKSQVKPPPKPVSPRPESFSDVNTTECADRSASVPHPLHSPIGAFSQVQEELDVHNTEHEAHDGLVPQTPYIHDPGNGPRVRDTRAFLYSYFAQPPGLNDPLCAEFAQEEVCQMLCTVLPEETALILWYNKSRVTGRICPACQRLYRLGDHLPTHMQEEEAYTSKENSPIELSLEQEISGLCSPVCFILASFNYPGAIKSTWGRMADELSSETWELLNSPGEGHGDKGLGLLLKMTRLEDLGLAQLCLPEIDFDSGYDSDPSQTRSHISDQERHAEKRVQLARSYTTA